MIQLYTARLREQIELSQKLLNRLEAIAQAVSSMQAVSVEALIQTIEAMNMLEKYYTPEQLESLRQRQELVGEERIKQLQAEWQDLFEQARAEMAKGTDPGIEQSLNRMYQQEQPEVVSRGTVDAAMMEYLGRARAALEQPE